MGVYQTDAVWLDDLFSISFLELKNEPGLSGDPIYQGVADYAKVVARDNESEMAPFIG